MNDENKKHTQHSMNNARGKSVPVKRTQQEVVNDNPNRKRTNSRQNFNLNRGEDTSRRIPAHAFSPSMYTMAGSTSLEPSTEGSVDGNEGDDIVEYLKQNAMMPTDVENGPASLAGTGKSKKMTCGEFGINPDVLIVPAVHVMKLFEMVESMISPLKDQITYLQDLTSRVYTEIATKPKEFGSAPVTIVGHDTLVRFRFVSFMVLCLTFSTDNVELQVGMY